MQRQLQLQTLRESGAASLALVVSNLKFPFPLPAFLPAMNSTSNFWSERCVSATQLPLPTLLLKLYASYGSVIAAFCATSILSASLFIRLRFISPESRKSMWRLLRVFVFLLLLGSLSGIVAWSFRILIRVEDYTAIKVSDKAQAQDIIAQKYRVQGGWFGFYGVQFFCLSLAKLLVRHRPLPRHLLAPHVSPSASPPSPLFFPLQFRSSITFRLSPSSLSPRASASASPRSNEPCAASSFCATP
jgi:hypothetical protein